MTERVFQGALIEEIAQAEGHSEDRERLALVRAAAKQVLELIDDGLRRDGVVRLHNFGTFRLKPVRRRAGHNPRTGEALTIPAHHRVVFTPAKALLDRIEPYHPKPKTLVTSTAAPALAGAGRVPAGERPRAATARSGPTQAPAAAQAGPAAVSPPAGPSRPPVERAAPHPPRTAAAQSPGEATSRSETTPREQPPAAPVRAPVMPARTEEAPTGEAKPATRPSARRRPWVWAAAAAVVILLFLIALPERDRVSPGVSVQEAPSGPPPAEPGAAEKLASAGDPRATRQLPPAPVAPPDRPPAPLPAEPQPPVATEPDRRAAMPRAVTPAESSPAAADGTSARPEAPAPVAGATPARAEQSLPSAEPRRETTEAPAAPYFAARAHRLQPGDNLWGLSRDHYSKALLWPHIFRVNRDRIRDPDLIYSGERIELPTLVGPPDALTPEDRASVAEGYFLVYRHYEASGNPDALFALISVRWFDPQVFERHRQEINGKRLRILEFRPRPASAPGDVLARGLTPRLAGDR